MRNRNTPTKANPPHANSAHDVAKKRAMMEHSLLLFSSATPRTETYHAAISSRMRLVTLTHRYGGRPLPTVDFIDMRAELAAGNPREVSQRMVQELAANLQRGEQSILLLNRRGYQTVGMCGTCGHVLKCPNCSVPLVYHKAQHALLCHYCGHRVSPVPGLCPECGGKIVYSGFGTQKVEEELAELLPGTRILRMDQDSTMQKNRPRKNCWPVLPSRSMIFCLAPRWLPRAWISAMSPWLVYWALTPCFLGSGVPLL